MKELEYEVEELRAALKAATLLEFEVEALRATLKAAAQEKDDLEVRFSYAADTNGDLEFLQWD